MSDGSLFDAYVSLNIDETGDIDGELQRVESRLRTLTSQPNTIRLGADTSEVSQLDSLMADVAASLARVDGTDVSVDFNNDGAIADHLVQLDRLEEFYRSAATSADIAADSIVEANTRIGRSGEGFRSAGDDARRMGAGMRNADKRTSSLMNLMFNLGNTAQDAAYGFQGVANNIVPLIRDFQLFSAAGGALLPLLAGLGSVIAVAGVITAADGWRKLGDAFGFVGQIGGRAIQDLSTEIESLFDYMLGPALNAIAVFGDNLNTVLGVEFDFNLEGTSGYQQAQERIKQLRGTFDETDKAIGAVNQQLGGMLTRIEELKESGRVNAAIGTQQAFEELLQVREQLISLRADSAVLDTIYDQLGALTTVRPESLALGLSLDNAQFVDAIQTAREEFARLEDETNRAEVSKDIKLAFTNFDSRQGEEFRDILSTIEDATEDGTVSQAEFSSAIRSSLSALEQWALTGEQLPEVLGAALERAELLRGEFQLLARQAEQTRFESIADKLDKAFQDPIDKFGDRMREINQSSQLELISLDVEERALEKLQQDIERFVRDEWDLNLRLPSSGANTEFGSIEDRQLSVDLSDFGDEQKILLRESNRIQQEVRDDARDQTAEERKFYERQQKQLDDLQDVNNRILNAINNRPLQLEVVD